MNNEIFNLVNELSDRRIKIININHKEKQVVCNLPTNTITPYVVWRYDKEGDTYSGAYMVTEEEALIKANLILPVKKEDNIKLEGYEGTFYIINQIQEYGTLYYILESEIYGDEAYNICARHVDGKYKVIYDEFNDLETLRNFLEEEPDQRY